MKQKTIHVISKYFYPVAAGIETNILETYRFLVEQGWKVIIHTSMDTLTEKNILKDKLFMMKGIEVRRYPFGLVGYNPKLDWTKESIIALHNFNVFPHSLIMAKTFLYKITGKKKYKLVLTPHGGFNPEWSVFGPISGFFKKIYHFTIGTLLINLSVDRVRAVSEWERKEIISKGVKDSKITVIPNGVEDEAYLDVNKFASKEIKEKVKRYGKYIIQVGRVYPIKNYETIIKALPRIPKNINYIIVGPLDFVMGKATYKEQLIKLAKRLGVEKRVVFAGVLRGVDKYYIIKHAQMMVHMALWESFCNVVHEGLSQGLACIVADNTALPFLVRDGVNGYVLPTKNATLLAEKINFILKNKNTTLIKRMETRNRKYGLENSWKKVAIKVDILYKNLFKQSHQFAVRKINIKNLLSNLEHISENFNFHQLISSTN